jgi:hypothetical protein
MPIWGGDETLARLAHREQVFLVASGCDHPACIMDPWRDALGGQNRAPLPSLWISIAVHGSVAG